MSGRVPWLALAALLAAAWPGHGAAAAPPPAEGRAALAAAVDVLLDDDPRTAAPAIEAAAQARPDDPEARAALGLLRLYQHRYAEAARLLESAGVGKEPGSWLAQARAAAAREASLATTESDHFVVAWPKGKDEVLVPDLLAALEAQRAALAQDLGYAPGWKVRVEILDGVGQLAQLSSLSDKEIRTSGTIALCKYDKLMITSPKALVTGYDWLDTAAHEYTHYVVTARTRNRTPIWLQEGIAKWSESRWRGAGGQSFSPFSAALVRRALEEGKLITFEQMHPSMAKLPSQEAAALAFAEVVLAVEYLEQQGGSGAVGRVLDLVADGTPADQAVAAVLSRPWSAFLAGWKQHLATRPLPKGGEHALRQLRFRDDPRQAGAWVEWAELPDETSRGFARLGELMRERGRWAAARVEYGKALARVGPRVAVLSNQFAIAAVRSGRPAEAEKVLGEAIGWNPDSAALRVQLARLLLQKEAWAAAREQLTLANRQDPFDPEIHAGLARALEALGDPGGASRERRFAEILQPQGHP